jgi:selenocysteine-specific elongation factor
VTGTLDGGRLAPEDPLTLFPEGLDVRVRRLEVHGEERAHAQAGERTSLNLAGVERATLRRGQALVARGGLEPTSVLTVEVTWLPSVAAAVEDGARLRVHLGTADVAGRVHRLALQTSEDRAFVSGSNGFAQITLESPLPARLGDRFVLRRPSPVETVGGGRVLDAGRPRLKRRSGAEVDRILSVLARGDEKDLADLFLLEAGAAGLTAARLGPRLGVPASSAASLLDALSSSGKALRIAPALYAHAGAATSLAERVTAAFAERKKSGTASVSFAKSEFAERIGKALSPAAVDGWIAVLAASKKLAVDGDRIVPPGAKAADLAGDSASFAAKIAEGYRKALFEPPRLSDLATAVGTKPAVVEGLVSHLVKSGILVRLSPDLVVHRDVAAAAEKKLETVRGQTLSVAGFRDLIGLTRKTLIPLLEYFDAKKLTRRSGDARKVE